MQAPSSGIAPTPPWVIKPHLQGLTLVTTHSHLWWAEEVEEAFYWLKLGLRLGIWLGTLLRLLLHYL